MIMTIAFALMDDDKRIDKNKRFRKGAIMIVVKEAGDVFILRTKDNKIITANKNKLLWTKLH